MNPVRRARKVEMMSHGGLTGFKKELNFLVLGRFFRSQAGICTHLKLCEFVI